MYFTYSLLTIILILCVIIIILVNTIRQQKKDSNNIISNLLHGIQTPLTIMKGEIDLFEKTTDQKKLIKSSLKSECVFLSL